MSQYRIEKHEVTTTRTDQWNPRQVTEQSYWVVGPGMNRPARVEEIDIMRGVVQRCIEIVKPFNDYVNIQEAGGDPETALRKEFGL